jgi:transposase
MDHIGIDVHKRESQIYILAEGGEVVEQRTRTEPERFAAVLGTRPSARILIEASTDSEWVARCLEALGHEVRAKATLARSGGGRPADSRRPLT